MCVCISGYFSESGGYPGQIFAWLQGICVPLVIAIDSDGLNFQIVKPSSPKVKALDMVVTKYSSAEGSHAILASVNDDGTLKFFSLNSDATSSWLPAADIAAVRSFIPKTLSRLGSMVSRAPPESSSSSSSSNPVFPVDFFEDCIVLTDVEFGGDLVDCYPKSKLKSRLDQNTAYIVSEKTGGFTIDITSLDSSQVICGFRIGLGAEGVDKIPAYVKVSDSKNGHHTPEHDRSSPGHSVLFQYEYQNFGRFTLWCNVITLMAFKMPLTDTFRMVWDRTFSCRSSGFQPENV